MLLHSLNPWSVSRPESHSCWFSATWPCPSVAFFATLKPSEDHSFLESPGKVFHFVEIPRSFCHVTVVLSFIPCVSSLKSNTIADDNDFSRRGPPTAHPIPFFDPKHSTGSSSRFPSIVKIPAIHVDRTWQLFRYPARPTPTPPISFPWCHPSAAMTHGRYTLSPLHRLLRTRKRWL